MGLVAGGALGTTVEADPALLWPVPDHWSLQDAATVPLPYAMAYYCLVSIFFHYKQKCMTICNDLLLILDSRC